MILLSSAKIRKRFTESKVAFMLLAALVTAGCQASPTPDEAQWISAEQATLEYKDEARKLALAPGWEWPQGRQYESHASDGNEINYGVNTGRVDAAWYWHCTWARNYFSATSTAERGAAFQQVLRLKESAFYHYGLVSEDKGPRDRVLALAESGETEQLRDTIEANCPRKDMNLSREG
ncbi:hypothetical protein QLQ12_46445 [Actinoplanes sp. NEAU-A12]|uniref:Lipoprotein n=1 Tax=Actinoplanes sandaracinus TaxID=3045177 RepID=A0ABT6X200_9ACTN|nr:hypothetical protein [Actinoplanes sandaracinus]MDI6106030.1 hypothetical protein [Actinoplanes sandaracinus]